MKLGGNTSHSPRVQHLCEVRGHRDIENTGKLQIFRPTEGMRGEHGDMLKLNGDHARYVCRHVSDDGQMEHFRPLRSGSV